MMKHVRRPVEAETTRCTAGFAQIESAPAVMGTETLNVIPILVELRLLSLVESVRVVLVTIVQVLLRLVVTTIATTVMAQG